MKPVCKSFGLSLLAVISCAVSGHHAIGQVNSNRPRISEPDLIALSGTAEAPRQVRPGDLLHYVIKGKDMDQPVGGGDPVSDREFSIRPVVLRSFALGSIKFSKREIASNGTVTYDVSGRAASAPGTYLDTFVAFDHRAGNDPRKDNPIAFTQTVVIKGDAPQSASAPFVPAPKVDADRAATSRDRTTRERYSAPLRSQIGQFLRRRPRPRGILQENGMTSIPLSVMPAALRHAANDYIQRVRSGPIQTALTAPEEQGTYRIVLLPVPYTALGVDVESSSGGMIHY